MLKENNIAVVLGNIVGATDFTWDTTSWETLGQSFALVGSCQIKVS